MKKWEYKFLTIFRSWPSDLTKKASWPVRFDNGQELPNWRNITVYDYCNELGQDGWEMVNLSYSPVFDVGCVGDDASYYGIVLKKEI